MRIIMGIIIGGLMGYFSKCSAETCSLTNTPKRGLVYGAILGLMFGLI